MTDDLHTNQAPVEDSLRTRIAAALKEAKIVSYWREGIDEADGQPYRSLVIRSDEQAAEYAADAVIRELGIGGHTESFIDADGDERCSTCDKWLEPGYYTLKDHRASMLRDAVREWTADE